MAKFICPRCENTWTMKKDKNGLYDGYGNPPCPECGTNGCDPNDYKDYRCPYCGKEWRQYGDGGLVMGCWPNCPRCGTLADEA